MSAKLEITTGPAPRNLLASASFEVTPKTWHKFRTSQPEAASGIAAGTKVFIAHIAGTPIDQMVGTARALRMLGLEPVPHLPARLIEDGPHLHDILSAYRGEAGVSSALVIAGGVKAPAGAFASSMDLMATGMFDRLGFAEIVFAGHPEGSRDIDPDGGTAQANAALRWKQDWRNRSGMRAALLTQFLFASAPALDWARRQRDAGVDLPITIGLAGPTRLAELIRYGISCGVGPSLAVLQRRAPDFRKFLRPITPEDIAADLAAAADPTGAPLIAGVHIFPFGGLADFLDWQAKAISSDPAR
ncbi:methylenetetrahydrofolate reductase [Paenirhodobacter sp.]|uniref:methylenetetrahydrofolate reductase n=1 Tax=Paenirhodobacter sp. TaxID=1965326 RepID=UPI003B3D7476